MIAGRRFKHLDVLVLSCALASGCDAPSRSVESPSPVHGFPEQQVESALTAVEPRRLSDPSELTGPLVPVGFRSRRPTESLPDPEVSLGTPVDMFAQKNRDAASGSKAFDSADLEPNNVLPLPADRDEEVANLPPTTTSPPDEAALNDPARIEPLPVASAPPELAPAEPAPVEPAPVQSAPVQSAPAQLQATQPDANEVERLPQIVSRPRSAEMDAVCRRADAMVRQGFRLAERGAVYSARKTFFEALGMVAGAHDVEQRSQEHTRALTAGRTALTEARQFAAHGMAAQVDFAPLVAMHRTPVLKQESLDGLSPIVAQQRYYTYAQEQLALAAGGESSAAAALYGLGKSAPLVHPGDATTSLSAVGEQVVCYQAALMADSQNYLAANELGVIFAQNGRAVEACDLFQSSLAISEHGATWHNLAVVLATLGDNAAADRALRRAEQLRPAQVRDMTGDNVRWVDPATFAKNVSPSDGLFPPQPPVKQAATPAEPPKKRTAAKMPWSRNTVH